MMKTGIALNAYPCSFEEQITLMKRYGFEATFCHAAWIRLDEITELCKKYGIAVENFHASFSHINDIWRDIPEGDAMLHELIQGVDVCKKYGVDTLIVHLSRGGERVRFCETGFSRLNRLMAYAKEHGVTIAFENLTRLSDLACAYEEYDEAGFCWDTGHEMCYTHGRQHMPLFGDKIAAVHIHDNYCVAQEDLHMIPYDGNVDFDRVTTQLANSNYRKAVMLEVMAHRSEAYLQMGADKFYEKAAAAAKRLAGEIDRKRAK